jgi:hypothetical protein
MGTIPNGPSAGKSGFMSQDEDAILFSEQFDFLEGLFGPEPLDFFSCFITIPSLKCSRGDIYNIVFQKVHEKCISI